MDPGLPGHKPDADTFSPAAFPSPGSSSPIRSIPGSQSPQIPDHELLRLIGRGAYGEVWMARNAIGTLRAVKIVHRQSFLKAEHFEREFKGLLKFEPISRSHDGLVDILQIGRRDDAGYFYYVMELADDAQPAQSSGDYVPRTLRSELQAKGELPPAECVSLGLKLASALEHLHKNGLVHRDIKPSNIIFVKGEPKLADIGLVTAIDDAHSLVGTAGYIPPEGPGKPQADLFSLGKVLYEIAFGKERHEFPQLPPDLSSSPDYSALLELNEVVLKACETDPQQRYADAPSLARDLALLQQGRSVKEARSQAQRWKALKRFGLAVAAITLLIVVLLRLTASKPVYTPNPEAARLYGEGQWYYSRVTSEDHVKALEKLKQAVEADPKFIQPYREMTLVYAWPMLPEITNDQLRLQKLQEVAAKAFAVAPDSAEGHMALSWCRLIQRNWRGAEDEIKQALRINPNLALAHDSYCYFLSMQMRSKEARREAEWTATLPPVSRRASAIFAACSFMAERRFDAAVVELKQVLDLDPNFAWGYSNLGDCYEAQSNYVAAIEAFKKAATLSGLPLDKVAAVYADLRDAFNAEGEQGYFRKWIELLRTDMTLPENERILTTGASLGSPTAGLAGCYAKLGEKQQALDELEKQFDEPYAWTQIKFETRYDSLHEEDRYKELVKRAGLEP